MTKSSASRTYWKVIDRGVNDQPFLWRKSSQNMFVIIDILNPDSAKGCYSVYVSHGDPYRAKSTRKVVGIACADRAEGGWIRAYERARRIAERFMAQS
ncbi:MAG TPA: hypothetical protein VMU35_03905 [Methylomirabilota bacterium]|nr:hypothetical protein [Methylomirabilota bacterium]